jgi:hypothetical protein
MDIAMSFRANIQEVPEDSKKYMNTQQMTTNFYEPTDGSVNYIQTTAHQHGRL